MRFLFWLSLFSAIRRRNRSVFCPSVRINTVSCGSFSLFFTSLVYVALREREVQYITEPLFRPTLPLHTSNGDTRCSRKSSHVVGSAACGGVLARVPLASQRSAPCGSFSHKNFIRLFFWRSAPPHRTGFISRTATRTSGFCSANPARWIAYKKFTSRRNTVREKSLVRCKFFIPYSRRMALPLD